jgi:hypothetical protein
MLKRSFHLFITLVRMAVPNFSQKWFLAFGFGYLRTVSWVEISPGFFAVSTLLKPAQMLKSAEREIHKLH